MNKPTLDGEQLVAISEVPTLLPARHGKRLHMSTVYRWVLKGARVKVLDSAMLGGVRYTSLEALQRFMGTSPAELIEARRLARIRATLSERGLTNPRKPADTRRSPLDRRQR
ncbi:DUF1580 domain-containing protein [Botrimarina mediterranea]|uniref:DUF1580 domain-containing protein n=1 Tax=Botrimarina mediterranea TaxID=2528022 RepID=A0A518K7U0_9BACT|nr:DUF1580 domain-containing protein [Botrimarina mediterranea]QDV73859.1 hypothetical protein Spa11_20580 [Botrimarina mediterranea]QDV78489.1 hypothetical protein K2D_20960 [Planctomycetes bacterium K2D]